MVRIKVFQRLKKNDTEYVRTELQKKSNPCLEYIYYKYAIEVACELNHNKIVEIILNNTDYVPNILILQRAVEYNNFSVVKALMNKGVKNINILDINYTVQRGYNSAINDNQRRLIMCDSCGCDETGSGSRI